MAVYETIVLVNRPPLQKMITAVITGTLEDTLVFSRAMTRFVAQNTGTAPVTFMINSGRGNNRR